ncbi:MAG: methyltransferase domain-containing protein [Nitrospirae bacterium]|nr:methyltransferase domain-containing protein [Nitrospirota bacterium]
MKLLQSRHRELRLKGCMMITDDLAGLRKLYLGFTSARVILTANNLGLFEQLKRPLSGAALARRLGTDLRATRILLDALTGLGLISKSPKGTCRNGVAANSFLVRGSRLYQGDILRHASTMWQNFSALDEVVRTGRPARCGFDHESFIMGMHNLTVLRAEGLIKAVGVRGVKSMLDLGGGPGTNAIAIAKRGIRASIFDLPETIRIARKVVRREGAKGIRFMAGNFHTDSIGSGYDLVLLSQIFHAFSAEENIRLLRKCHAALNPRGRVVVQEFPINDELTQPPQSALFSVNMLVGTESGRCYSPAEIKRWLQETGYKNILAKDLPETVLVIGGKGK